MKSIMRKFQLNCELSVLISTLAIGVALCAPQQQPSISTLTPKSSQSSSPTSKTTPTSSGVGSTSNQATSSSNLLASAASTSNGSPSLVNLKPVSSNNNDELDTFDGKNPFSDDSLWQIPIHLVRDSSANENQARPSSSSSLDGMAKSASEKMAHQEASYSDNDDVDSNDDDSPILAASLPPQSASSSSPTIISASTDLKTAAGYHYPTHGGHHGFGGHHGGYGGGHHGGHGDHYGKYFQYASVPYPHAWEFGYRRGNPYHTIERYEHGKGPHFQTKVKWSDKHGGYGVHVWDYNHDDHHSHHQHYDSHGPSHYGGHHGHHGYGHSP